MLLTQEITDWIDSLDAANLSATQQMALAQMHDGRAVTNQTMRNFGLDARRATTELADLVARGLAVRIGERRHSRCVLTPEGIQVAPETRRSERADADARAAAILRALASGSELSRRDIEKATGLNQVTAIRTLDALIAAGKVEATAPPRSPHRRYRRTART